ncbi:MAG: hypothetical protein ACRDGN_11410 [bacterium]
MSRASWAALILACLALPELAFAQGSYAAGSVVINRRPDNDIDSSAVVQCYNWLGYEDPNCVISGLHFIFDTADGGWLNGKAYTVPCQYSGYTRGSADRLHCYRARVTVEIYGSSYANAWGSGQVCVPAPPPPEDPPPTCPVLIDLDGNGFHLSGPDEPVAFDLDADGVREELAWTAAGQGDAFLCLDRNGNGAIDNGEELFGWATPLATGERAEIGYVALAALDGLALGGNGDGVLDESDAAFGELCVWTDANRDGISEPGELRQLEETAITALEYAFTIDERRDRHGNLFRYKSRGWAVNPGGNVHAVPTYDVIFARP